MSENLKSKMYSDGTPLVDGSPVAGSILGDFTTKYYFSYFNETDSSDIYGYLYTWVAAMNAAACHHQTK